MPSEARIRVLNVHASYACRRSGACCTAGWTIPVDPPKRARAGGIEWLIPDADGACPRYDRVSGLCQLQRDHGESALPESCHHFPRRALVDEDGVSVTLSHFCPTAAALLVDASEPLRIVDDAPAFPAGRTYDGLDARGEWPPLLRPGVLMGRENHAAWERWLIQAFSDGGSVAACLERVGLMADRLRRWTDTFGTMEDWVASTLEQPAGSRAGGVDAMARYDAFAGVSGFVVACESILPGLDAPVIPASLADADAHLVAPAWDGHAPAICRYLGARAFASWTAYQSRGIRTEVAELVVAAGVLRVECARACLALGTALTRDALLDAVRRSDLLLMHLVDRAALMARLGQVETDAPTAPARR